MRSCPLCGTEKDEEEFDGIYCGRCDKICGDVQADLAADYRAHNNVV
jgi:hypothetical protein